MVEVYLRDEESSRRIVSHLRSSRSLPRGRSPVSGRVVVEAVYGEKWIDFDTLGLGGEATLTCIREGRLRATYHPEEGEPFGPWTFAEARAVQDEAVGSIASWLGVAYETGDIHKWDAIRSRYRAASACVDAMVGEDDPR